MDLDELRTVQRTEREKDSLQHLRDSFYEDVAEYIQNLKARRDRAAEEAEDPFASDEVRRLTDEIETAEEVAEAIYERRVGKVVKHSSFAAADMSVDRDGMTAQELALFDDLVERIKQNKSTVLDILAGESIPDAGAVEPAASPRSEPSAAPDASAEAGGVLADAMGGDEGAEEPAAPEADPDAAANSGTAAAPPGDGGSHTPVEPETAPPGAPDVPSGGDGAGSEGVGQGDADPDATAADADPDATAADADPDASVAGDGAVQFDADRTTVRITQDVGAVLGADDREYDLADEDVVTLPSVNAEPLLQKGAAERLD